ncbi:MAG: hypothetical protein ACKOQ3_09650 [Novosphingobium sp.]
MLDHPLEPPDWCARLIMQIASEPRISLVALIRSDATPARHAMSPFARCLTGLERTLAACPQSADRDEYAKAIAHASLLTSASVDAVSSQRLDVILDLSAGQGASIAPDLASHGVWYADFLDPATGWASFSAKTAVTRIALFRRTTGRSQPVGVAEAALNPKFIAARNALFMREKAVPLILRALRRTQMAGRPDEPENLIHTERPHLGSGEMSRYLRHLTRNLTDLGLDYVRSRTHRRPGMFFLKSSHGSLLDFDPAAASPHVSKTNSYFADPFLWDHEGETFCFFEEYDYRTAKGHISAGRLVEGELLDVRPVLQTGYHLSFPFLFEHGGELYMLPETSEVRRLEVWRCVDFPDRWERHATALDGVSASDSTLNLIDGTWWLFTNLSRDPFIDMNSELHVFRVDGPALETIEAHAFNPVVMDANRARNAGRILDIDGKLYRPAQENSHGRYGYGLRLMEIRSLSLDEYDEVEARAIAPDFEPGITGCHHLDVRNGHIVMDVRRKVGGYAR